MTVETYLGNRNLKRANVNIQYSAEELDEYLKCAEDPLYFINNYVKIIDVDQGLVQFKMRPYQEDMVLSALNNRFTICKMPRQVGKTTTVVAFMLWLVLFTETYSVAILANKEKQAIEILERIKLAYEHLPKWLQQGVVEWNKKNIELENGSQILASSTSSSAIRGSTQNFVYLDEFAFVPTNIQHSFFSSVYPVISSGKTTKIFITSTPNGMNMFYKLWRDSEENRNLYKRIDIHWSDVPGRDELWKEETIKNTSEEQFRQEFECEFLGSTNTLITATKLRNLSFKNPIFSNNNFDIYENPEKGKEYVIIADTSRGLEGDYSAFIVINISEYPYRGVAKYKSNTISPLLYPNIIYNVAKKYNNSYVLVEINDNGQQIADILHYDLEYENVLSVAGTANSGQTISGGFGRSNQLGVRTTKQVKRIGCSTLKDLIENDQFIMEDYDLVNELSTFIQVGSSFEAEEGYNDDLAMCMVLFGWLVRQPYFKDLTNFDMREKFLQEKEKYIEEDVLPFGFKDDGIDHEMVAQERTWHDYWNDPGNKTM